MISFLNEKIFGNIFTLVNTFNLNGGVANSFEFKLDGWREFKFGQLGQALKNY